MDKIRLDDIATLINGDRGRNYPSQADITDEGDIPFVNAGHLNGRSIDFEEMNYISQDKFNCLSSGKFIKGDILYCLRGSLGKKAIVNDDVEGAIASSLVIIRPDYTRIDGDYLMFSLDSPSIKEQLIKANNGSSQPNLSAASVREYQIELPDLKIQKDVVNKLAKVRTIIDSRQHEIDLLDDLIKARFVELYNSSSLGEETTLEAITERVKVGFVGTCEKYYTDASGIPMLRTGNITDNGIDLADLKYVTQEFHEKNKKSRIHEGDLLIARHGSNGQANVYYGPEAQCLNAVVIVPNYEITTSVFLAGLINSPVVKEQIERTLVGSTQHVVNTKSIASLVVRIPDLTVQKGYETFVKQVDKSKVAVQKSLDETQRLFDSLMQEYFG